MKSFALITEGITDQVALEAILIGHYGDEPEIRQIQPLRDATDESRQGNFAGWEKALEYCRSAEFANLFSTNDYVIIQVDTDICEHKNFGVLFHSEDGEKTAEELTLEVKEKIISCIDEKIYQNFKDRIFFAICVHSLECWILPLFSDGPLSKRTKNCERHLASLLGKLNIKYEKNYRAYQSLTAKFLKSKALAKCKEKNKSMETFLLSLPSQDVVLGH